MLVFDRMLIRQRRERAARLPDDHRFIARWAMQDLAGRLAMIRRAFPMALQIGAHSPLPRPAAAGIETLVSFDTASRNLAATAHAVRGDDEYLPFRREAFDLIVSLMTLHTINDLPGALIQIRQCLKPDGLFLAAMIGGETLHALRAALTEAEIDLTGGASPRIAPFADKQQMGALMQRAGFALPVVDSDILKVTYPSLRGLMHDLRGMGETAAMTERRKRPAPRALFDRAEAIYRRDNPPAEDGRIEAIFEIIFLTGWAPADNQQKPLRPGSADYSLADVLEK